MKINFLLLALFSLSLGCSKSDESLFGSRAPSVINKEILPISEVASTANKTMTSDYQKHLNTLLETEMVRVTDLKLYQNGESYIPLLKMAENSQKYFYMNVLSFTCDAATEKLVQLLENKAKSGVKIKLITNKGFSFLSRSCLNRLKKSGIEITKNKTHSSYFLNDQQELMIGSQSIARMFFLADGFNSLDRDMMLYSKGPLATDALKDFISTWSENNSSLPQDLKNYEKFLKTDVENMARGDSLYLNKIIGPDKMCRFVSERPGLGVKDIQMLWKDLVDSNQRELFFSGVKVETANGDLGKIIKRRSLEGVKTHYLGNGYLSGDGELTMVLDEWIKKSPKISFLLEKIKIWDMKRVAQSNESLYDSLKEQSKINVWGYFNFIHYKVWLFDNPGFFIGSANLDESKFGVVDEAGVYCLDVNIHNELKSYLIRDQKNSTLYIGGKK